MSAVPTAITGPVSALHSSLICHRHSSGGALHAGNSDLHVLKIVCLLGKKYVSVFVQRIRGGVRTLKNDLSECMSVRGTGALCVGGCYHHNTACKPSHHTLSLSRSDLTFGRLILAPKQGSQVSGKQVLI